jgi:sulfoxide reductase heme-binding subunit YedZ
MRSVINNQFVFWLLLALPGVAMTAGLIAGQAEAADLLHPSGEWSARLMIVAMAIAPAIAVFGSRPWLAWLAARRRWLGVAAFGYGVLHLVYYVIDMGNVADMLAEALAPGIWTGWAALAAMLLPAATSSDRAMRALRAGWKRIQRLVYPAAVLTLLHWIWVHNNLVPALVHFVPLALIVAARAIKPFPQPTQGA